MLDADANAVYTLGMRTIGAKDIVESRVSHIKDGWATLSTGEVVAVVAVSTREAKKANPAILTISWMPGCAPSCPAH